MHPSPKRGAVWPEHCDAGAKHVAADLFANHSQPQPVLLVSHVIDEKARWTIVVGQQDVGIAVIIDVPEGHSPADLQERERLTGSASGVLEASSPRVVEESLRQPERIAV